MNIIEKKWNDILDQIRKEHELSAVSFNTWLKPLTVYSYENHTVRILVPLQRVGLDYISKKFMLPLKVAVTEVTGEECIRDIIAFPMNAKARDLLMNAPGDVTKEQLKEIHISIDDK